MASIFSRIVSGEIPAYRIAENDRFLAFLDINPQVEGHTLVIPKVEVDNLWDLDDALLQEALVFAKPVAKALERAFACNRCGLSVIGFDVPHAHIHLLPISSVEEMNPKRSRLETTPEALQAAQERILARL